MEQKGLISVSTNSVTKELELSRMDDDIILFDDFANLPVPYEPRRNMGLIVGLCLQGGFRYTADTVEHSVHAGEALIIHEGQVVENYWSSNDIRGIGIMMSYDFFMKLSKAFMNFLLCFSSPVVIQFLCFSLMR